MIKTKILGRKVTCLGLSAGREVRRADYSTDYGYLRAIKECLRRRINRARPDLNQS